MESEAKESMGTIPTFDSVYKEWMQKILIFVKKISLERDSYPKDIFNKPEYSFLGTAEAVADQFFYFLMKDELSQSNGNAALDMLCEYLTEKDGYINEIELIENRNYMITLCTQEFNGLVAGQFYDFYISIWSCFEAAINCLCEPFEDEIKKKLDESNYVKTLKFITDCMENDEIVAGISDALERNKDSFIKKFPKYISFPDKIDYLLKNILKSYSRNKKSDKKILLFCGKLRNTIHNNGLNRGETQEIEISGHIFKLERKEKVYYESLIDNIILVNEVFDIYVEIMRAWKRDFSQQ